MRVAIKVIFISFLLVSYRDVKCNYFTQGSDSVSLEDSCGCKPSLPIEIASSSVLWGFPTYWMWRSVFDHDSTFLFHPERVLILPSLFLLMFSLGPIAEWTSGCEASYWHTLWIGLGTQIVTVFLYGGIYGFQHPLNWYKFNFAEYVAISVVPSVASSLIYNIFLRPQEKKNHSMLFFPSFGGKNTASMNFIMQF